MQPAPSRGGTAPSPLLLLVVALLLGACVVLLGLAAVPGTKVYTLDLRVLVRMLRAFHRHGGPWPLVLGPPVMMTVLAAVSLLAAAWRRRLSPLVVGAAALLLNGLAVIALKATFERPSPTGGRANLGAFPSGHTTTAVVAVAVSLWLLRTPAAAALVGGLAAGCLVGGAMVVSASHWVSDVLGGLMLGSAVVTGLFAVAVLTRSSPGRARGVQIPTDG